MEQPQRPNVLLVTFDTLRADYLQPYGGTETPTPGFAALAEEAAVFEWAFATVPLTYPSLWSLLNSTRLYDYTYATDLRERPRGDGPLAQALADAGYVTAAVTGSSILDRGKGFEDGFDEYLDTWNEPWLDNETTLARVLELADGTLRGRSAERPYFLYVHFFDPHDTWGDAPSRFNVHGPEESRFASVQESISGPDAARRPLLRKEIQWRSALSDYLNSPDLTEVDREGTFFRLFVPSYRAEVSWSDDVLGRLLAAFEQRGLMEETLLIVSADHGIAFADHHMVIGYVFDLFNEVVRVPLVIRTPERRAARITAPVSLVDVGATVLDYAGAGTTFGDGISLRPALEGRQAGVRPVYAETVEMRDQADFSLMLFDNPGSRYGFGRDNVQSMLVSGDRKLIHMPSRSGERFELYDLGQDPREQRDLFDPSDPEHLALVEQLLDLRFRNPVRGGEAPDAEMLRRLRSLGYIGD